MIVTLAFHSAFRIGTGNADGTAHATIDRDTPVPASSLKGLMRASADRLLPYRPEVVDAVFGTPGAPAHGTGAQHGSTHRQASPRTRSTPSAASTARTQSRARTPKGKRTSPRLSPCAPGSGSIRPPGPPSTTTS